MLYFLWAGLLLCFLPALSSGLEFPVRAIEMKEDLQVTVPPGSKEIRVWIPVPQDHEYQRSETVSVQSPIPYRTTVEKTFGNRFLYFETYRFSEDSLRIQVQWKIVRKEQKNPSSDRSHPASLYLKSRGLEVVNEEIVRIAEDATTGIDDPFGKAKSLYRYVLGHMKYDKSGTGWGKGDVVYTCRVGRGNCTDFHSLFIALARASKIPARFQMGFPLPKTEEGTLSNGYHCWAEFYVKERGWIPVDISEAWKYPQKSEFYFGGLDAHRVALTIGREINLAPVQSSDPLNYMSQPYIEIDGRSVSQFTDARTFKNVSPTGFQESEKTPGRYQTNENGYKLIQKEEE
ncbi:MAG: transglutaminase domain-containing protein [Elusimicrobia bacterium]|nr:transglutaminase domain-containing protein [Elusimicrobiota bacterium]